MTSNYSVAGFLTQNNEAAPSINIINIKNSDPLTFQRNKEGTYTVQSEDLKRGQTFVIIGNLASGFACKQKTDKATGTLTITTHNLKGELADNLLSDTEFEILFL